MYIIFSIFSDGDIILNRGATLSKFGLSRTSYVARILIRYPIFPVMTFTHTEGEIHRGSVSWNLQSRRMILSKGLCRRGRETRFGWDSEDFYDLRSFPMR